MKESNSSRQRRVSIFGLGYVGSVMGACLAERGHRVLGVDLNPAKVEMLNAGRTPIVEPDMAELVEAGHKSCRLHATTDTVAAVRESEISFVCVGTPSAKNGKLDLSGIERVSEEIGRALADKPDFHWIAIRSTVLPGTADSIVIPALERTSGKREGTDFAVCANPEFMREGTAVRDFQQPPFTILGAQDRARLEPLRDLYEGLSGRVFEVSLKSAEMIKYLCNVFHAVKVDFANEMGTLGKQLGVDMVEVMEIFCADTKLSISPAYLKPGFAFGGSCLPKDVRALVYRGKELDLELPLVQSLLTSNNRHIDRAVEMILAHGRRKVGVLGLSFKAATDDLRESPLVVLVKRLLGEGYDVRIYDSSVLLSKLMGGNKEYINQLIPHIGSLLCPDPQEVMERSEILVIGNPDPEIEKHLDRIRPDQVVIDLRPVKRDRARPGRYQGICS